MSALEAQDYKATSPISTLGSDDFSRTTTHSHYGDREPPDDLGLEKTKEQQLAPAATGRSNSLGLQRTVTRRETVLSRIRSRPPVGNFNHPLENEKTTAEQLVDFDGDDDPYRPLNWTMRKKVITTALYGLTTMTAAWASSSFAPGTSQVSQEFHIGTEVATLGTTLFLFGFGVGPLLFAPLSEVYGRKAAVLPPMFVAACFTFGTGAAKDIQTIMLTRFWAGFFASAPVTNTGGVLADLFPASQRGIAIASYAMAVVVGPVFAPIVGAAFVVQPNLRWRWSEYFTGILQLAILVLDVIFLDESYPPKLLVYKARRLRHETGNWALHAKFEEWDVSISELAHKVSTPRPRMPDKH
jgi:MFS transporter, DHA1 family, multidrug resistance protein